MPKSLALILCLLLFACSEASGRSEATNPATEPQGASTGQLGGSNGASCVAVTCELEVSMGSLDYFTSPECTEESRLLPLMPNEPASGKVMCAGADAWVTVGRAEAPTMVWGGVDCREMPEMTSGFEWWSVDRLDRCQ